MEGRSVELRGVTVTYPDSAEPAVRNIDLTLMPGELIVLTGPNGGGKSTLLGLISGYIPTVKRARVEGEVRVCGRNPALQSVADCVQQMQQDPKLQVIGPTVFLEAAATPLLMGLPRSEVEKRAWTALRKLGIEDLHYRSTHTLSGGELQKTGFAGVYSASPTFLVLDEPTSYLDRPSRRLLLEILKVLKREGVGIIIAEHEPSILELADKIYIINGTIEEGVFRGSTPQLWKRRPKRHSTGDIVLEVENLTIKYPGSRKPAVLSANIRAERGNIIALVGPNGGGKSTLLNAIAGIIEPTNGRIVLKEKPVLLPQDPLLLFSKPTLREEASSPLPEWASEIADRPILTLSYGQLRLASLALVISSGRALLLLDEPTSGLDPDNSSLIWRILAGLADEGRTIIVATHDERAELYADRVYYVEGSVSCYGEC